MIPRHLHSLFWDTNLGTFDPAAHPAYTIARVLEYGRDEDVAWLASTFSREEIRSVLRSDARLTRRSATFWALVCGLPTEDVAALNTPH